MLDKKQQTIEIALSSIIIISIYVATQILSDIGSLKIAYIANFSIDAGTFIYPITFTLRDMIHKKLGKKVAQITVITCAGINLVMALYFAFVASLPSDPTWQLQEAYSSILGPVWRIVVASIVAEVVSELLDTEIYHLFVTKITTKYEWARVLVSNAVSVPIDSAIFAFIAFYGNLPLSSIISIIFANMIIKFLVTLISVPAIYLVKEKK
ncbi:MAG: queuosine precursor transporter [Treponema sp.]|nr:queuosine precursor transporter [Treponema sp.]